MAARLRRETGALALCLAAVLGTVSTARAQIESQPDFEKKEKDGAPPTEQAVTPPRLVQRTDPVYPAQALKEGRKGTVVLKVTIDEYGEVTRVDVTESAGADLDDAAMGAVCNFRFDPARADGEPIPAAVIYKQVFTFQETAPAPAPPPVSILEEPPLVEKAPEEKPVNFRGQVREMGTKDTIRDAEVTVILDDETMLTTTTDERGRFELRGIPKGEALVKIASTSHEVFTSREEFSDEDVLEARYFIMRRSYNRFETIVRDRTPPREVNRISMSRDEVNRVPGTFGDPIRAIENLPSMAQGALAGGQLLVRGTPPRSTAVYLDGVQIPQLYHFGLWRSVIHPEFLESIELHPGGFGPRYGRATAGVVDIKSRNLRMEQLRAQADVNLVDTGFFVGGPVVIGGGEDNPDLPNPRRVTFAAAARRSYIDALIPLALNVATPGRTAGSSTLAPIYSDYQFKLEWRPLASHRFSLMAFGSDDIVRFRFAIALTPTDVTEVDTRFELQFHRAIAKWDWDITPRVHNQLMVYTGLDSAFLGLKGFSRFQGRESITKAGINNTGPVFGFRNELRYDLAEWATFALGIDYALTMPVLLISSQSINPFYGEPVDELGNPTKRIDSSSQFVVREERTQLNLAPYTQIILQPLPRLQIIPGFRFDYFKYAGRTRFFAPTPRFAARWEPVDGTVVKATSGFYEQAPRAFETSPWVGNPRLLPERSFQNTVGIEQRLAPDITVQLNAFVNRRTDLIQTDALPINVDVDVGLPIFQNRFDNNSEGRVFGMDFLLRHEITKSFYGWIAYTLSKSEVRKRGDKDWRSFNFDQTHILTAVGQYRVPWHPPFRAWARAGRLPRGILWNSAWAILCGDLSLGLRFRYITGNPSNYLNALLPQDPTAKPPIFVRRFKPYHQVDVRLDYKIAFDLWVVAFSLDIVNLTNEQADTGDIPRIPLLPVLGLSFEI